MRVLSQKPATIFSWAEFRFLQLWRKSRYNRKLHFRSHNHHAMRTRGRVKVQLNAFLRFATDVKSQLRTRGPLSLKTSHRHPFTRRLGVTHTQPRCCGEKRIMALCWKYSHDYSDVAVLFQLFGRPRIQITTQGPKSLPFSTYRSTSVRTVPQIRLDQHPSIKAIKVMIQWK